MWAALRAAHESKDLHLFFRFYGAAPASAMKS
jgi:hypothetical protein